MLFKLFLSLNNTGFILVNYTNTNLFAYLLLYLHHKETFSYSHYFLYIYKLKFYYNIYN